MQTVMPRSSAAPTSVADIQRYLPLVMQIVARFFRRLPPNVLRDDLIAAGTYGLIDSLRKNSDTTAASFEWYARIRIRGAILDELRSQDWLSRRARSHATQASLAAGATGGATIVGFEDLSEAKRASVTTDPARSPLALVEEQRDREELLRAVEHLDERERLIVRMHYFKGVQFKVIAATLKVSEPRVSQLHARAMGKLRTLLEDPRAEAA